jgi:pyruvate/2-oxoglutarate/acetoin dehydrogenase E1 component
MKYFENIKKGLQIAIEEHDALLLGEDIAEPYGGAFKVTKGLSKKYPQNIMNTPMSEQGFTGMGIGYALHGGYVIVEIMFGDFITLCADQLINHAAKLYDLYGNNLHFLLRTPSGGYRGYGATHSQSMERLFVGIPGLQVLSPSVFSAPGELLLNGIKSGKPTLFIENKLDYNEELILDDTFDIFCKSSAKEDVVSINIRGG